ncbi:DUF4102 domain-containing protein [Acinetobacter bouvetii]|uniref:DUF4102 domain-containing protein n=1 Tax=Acinetobacter bouvetii TaxID=202951 RepID=A0A4V2DPX9_9GAMM|nr:DUF4102 domain-containing protein [Acinetobacter bouvetii]TCB72579.1 DUF4102 domain-containing protein [Acinetobacter sp. ANC 4177]
MSDSINFICCNPDLAASITEALIHSPQLRPKKKTQSADEKGMYLEVTPSGGMHWRMKFRFNAKKNICIMDSYPETILVQTPSAVL